MKLVPFEQIEYPHIDWVCDVCGTVYVSSGKPDTGYCPGGNHPADWQPNAEQIGQYIETLESLDVGEKIWFAAEGPAPLMGEVSIVGNGFIETESVNSPARRVEWDKETNEIIQKKADDSFHVGNDIQHIERVGWE